MLHSAKWSYQMVQIWVPSESADDGHRSQRARKISIGMWEEKNLACLDEKFKWEAAFFKKSVSRFVIRGKKSTCCGSYKMKSDTKSEKTVYKHQKVKGL